MLNMTFFDAEYRIFRYIHIFLNLHGVIVDAVYFPMYEYCVLIIHYALEGTFDT